MTRRFGRWTLILLPVFFLFLQSPGIAQPQPDDSALFREGEIFLSKGETEKALWRFKSVVTDFPQSPLINEAKFRMGICYTRLGRPRDAIRILSELFTTFLSPSRMVQVFSLLGDNYVELRDRPNALYWYGKGLLIPGQPNEELRSKVKSIMDASNTEEELKSIESLYRGAYAGGYAKLKLAQMARRQGNDLVARRYLMELEKEYRGMDYMPAAKEVLDTISLSLKSKYTVGVILPLSGIHSPFGERVLQGIQSAIKETDYPLISLAIRDSKGSPDEAEKAVEELVNKEKVIAIIGPLLSVDVDRGAKKAQQLKVPLLTFSQKEPASNNEDFVFRNSLSPSEQIQTLANFAVKELKLGTFAVFYPNSPYGLYFKNLFSQEITRNGGKVLGSVVYQEGQTDFSQEIKGFFRIKPVQKNDMRGKKEDEFMPLLSVDGVFIPDSSDRVGMILSQMAYYDVKGTFLGTNSWNGPGLISIGGKGSEGAVFVDAFFNKSPSPLVARFVEEFRKTFQRDPETLEALSYDGAKFIKQILQTKSVSSPSQVQEGLRQVKNFLGVSGLKGFGEDGRAIRTPCILKVDKGEIRQIWP
ncbi:MAG TPA: penicillin-binding protein activator [Thermodesulfobacteriota bacterium]|jgi:branched-chain amino acid transport system substrate-binding protein|nr:penicillin-binding protein activator [Thermodesulfobacteriota bacterium]